MKKILVYVKGFLIINFIWYIVYLIIKSSFIPRPIDVYSSFRLVIDEKMYLHIIISIGRIIIGACISLFLGSAIGYAMASFKRLDKLMNPIVCFTSPVPKAALLPIIIIIFGRGDASKIILITLIIIFQMILSVRDLVQNIDREYVEYILSLGASKKQVFYHIIIPEIIPGIISSIRVTIGTALSVLFFCEGFGTSWGIGYYVLNAWSRIDYLSIYKGIIIFSLVGVLLHLSIDLAERKIVKWKYDKLQKNACI